MYREIIAAGYGGQGALTIGEFLALAGIEEKLTATWVPTYGQEKRGGDANAGVILSSREIVLPLIERPDILLSMNEKSILRWGPEVKAGGAIFYNSSLIKAVNPMERDVYAIPCNEIAKKIGSEKVANIVLLGAYLAFDAVVGIDTVIKVIEDKIRNKNAELLHQNISALELGAAYFKKRENDSGGGGIFS